MSSVAGRIRDFPPAGVIGWALCFRFNRRKERLILFDKITERAIRRETDKIYAHRSLLKERVCLRTLSLLKRRVDVTAQSFWESSEKSHK